MNTTRTLQSEMNSHQNEIEAGDRFTFGVNWSRFLKVMSEARITKAIESLKEMLRADTLEGKHFLDAGSGSGLFSLAAHRLGATVYSFDYDPQSVACTRELKRRYYPGDPDWTIDEGSVLDSSFLAGLGRFDVVYSWGVLHHTGSMWQALDNVSRLVGDGGKLFIAIYNDEGFKSRYWHMIKKSYVRFPLLRWPLIGIHLPYPFLPSLILRTVTNRPGERGMSLWYDLVDWIGGYPFEVASPAELLEFYRTRGFSIDNIRTTNRLGCNQLVLIRERTI